MALSTDEHNLLVETCANMNTAAATCSDVLEMLRSLGNSGVVDIATHNNDSNAHASNQNLAHVRAWGIQGGRTLYHGPRVIQDLIDGYDANGFTVSCMKTRCSISEICLSHGRTLQTESSSEHHKKMYYTDGNDDRIPFEETTSVTKINCGKFHANLLDSNGKSIVSGFDFFAGDDTEHVPFSGDGIPYWGSIRVALTYGTLSSFSYAYTISKNGIFPMSGSTTSLGLSTKKFSDIYLANAPTVGSDSRLKKDVGPFAFDALSFVKALNPVEYKLKVGESVPEQYSVDGSETIPSQVVREGVRTHWGFIAQDVKAAMTSAGIEDSAVWGLADKNDPDSTQSLRYDELIAPLVKAVQILATRVEALEGRAA